MSRLKVNNPTLNIQREAILRKGYATIQDIRKWIPCGYTKAKEIYEREKEKANEEGKTTINGISAKRLLHYVFLSEDEILKYATKEKENVELSSFSKSKEVERDLLLSFMKGVRLCFTICKFRV